MVEPRSIQDGISELLTTAVLTDVGKRLLDEAYQSGRKLLITEMSLGDSNLIYVKPDPAFTGLVHEFGRQPINEGNSDKTWINAIVYVDAAKWKGNSILEFGLHDADGNMIVYSSYPRTTIPTEGAEYVQVEIECYLDLYNASSVTINITPIMPLASETESGLIKIATTDKVDDGLDDSTCITPLKLKEKTATDEDVDSQSNANKLIALPQFWRIINPIKGRVNEALNVAHSKWTYVQASLTTYGATKLSSVINSTSESLAATSLAVKLVADIANSKMTQATADSRYVSKLQVSSSVTSTSTTSVANSAAAKTAMDRANAAYNKADTRGNKVYAGSSPTNTDFPVGTNQVAWLSGVGVREFNKHTTIYFSTNPTHDNYTYKGYASQGAQIAGTWAKRTRTGTIGNTAAILVERIL